MREPLRWDSQAEPTALAQVVHAGWLQRLLRAEDARRFPGPGGGVGVEALARRVFEGFVELGISYVHEPADSGPGTQLLRPLDEVVSLHQATCLDMCAAYCSAALDAGVYPLILTIRKEGRRHALVLIPLDRNWSRGCDPVLEAGFGSEVLTVDDDPVVQLLAAYPGDALGTWLAVDVQQASAVGGGLPGDWGCALDRGAEYVRDWQWEVCVDVGGLCAQRRADDSLPPVVRAGEVLAPAYTELPQDFTALQLIRTRYNVVPFCPRPELAQLREWALGTAEAGSASAGSAGARTAPDLAIAVVAGAGGTGKTRLAAQLCHSLSAIGWCTGFVPSTSELTEADLEVLAELTTELLIVVDYAEEARKEQLATLLRRLRERRSPTRIVLTARGTDVWWPQFQEELVQDGIGLGRTLMITGLGRHPDSPLLFRKAVRRFSQRLGLPVSRKLETPAEPGTTALEVVLRAWLAVVEQVGEAEVDESSVGREALFDRVLDVEFARWKQFPALGEVSAVQLRRAAATMSLLAPRGETGVDEVLSRLPEWAGAPRERSRLAELLATALLRPATADEGVRLQPDPVADHLICSVFGADAGLLEQILPADLESAERLRQAVNACVVLTRAAGADQTVAQSLASTVLSARPQLWREALDVALAQGGPFVRALDELAQSGAELPFAEIDAAIPLGHSWLRGLAVTVARRLLEAGGQEPAHRAALLNNLANRLSEVGRRGEALVVAREAVGLYRVLAEQDPAAFTPNLAGLLSNLAIRLSEVGRRGEALVVAREAVGLYRVLAEQDPAAFTPDLAMSLSNLANRLSEVGRRGEALDAAREAVGLYRVLAEQDPAAFTPDLAGSLSNLAIRLSEVGRRGEALDAAREAVDLRRGLAEQDPAAFTPDLAGSLHNLANMLSEVGERGEALVVAREAVDLRRGLAEQDPEAFTPGLAGSLHNLANMLSEVGERGEALVVAREAVGLYRGLAEQDPAAFTPDLAASLSNLANRLSEVGERGEALVVAREAVDLRRGLAEQDPAAFTPELARSLNTLANRLSAVGERGEALVVAREAVDLYRGLAEQDPAAFTPDLAMSLSNLGIRLSAVGERGEAVEAAREAVDLRRGLAEQDPAAFTPDLAMSLHNLAAFLSAVGERGEALDAAREAVGLYRGLAERNPAAFTPDLAGSLSNLANMLSAVGQRVGALKVVREAVDLRRGLAEQDPAAFTPDLARSLHNLAAFLSEVGRRGEALDAAREAVDLRRGLAEQDPEAFTPDLAGSLNNLANTLSAVGERVEALEVAREAVDLYRGLAEQDPAAFTPDLARSLNTLANMLSAVGERVEALVVAREAVDLRRGLAEQDPAAFTPDLAMSLNNLANVLSAVGLRGEALDAAREAVQLRRGLAEQEPAAFTPDLAASLNNLANVLSAVGERDKAVEAAREAVQLRRGLAEQNPAAFTPNLVISLRVLASLLAEGGNDEEALSVFTEHSESFSPSTRARLLLARANWRDHGKAEDLVQAAQMADDSDDPALLGPVRREVVQALRADEVDTDPEALPAWVLLPPQERRMELLQGWLDCSDVSERADFLERNCPKPTADDVAFYAAAAELFTDIPAIGVLAQMVEYIAEVGIKPVAEQLRLLARAHSLAQRWLGAHQSGSGSSFLREQLSAADGTPRDQPAWERNLSHPQMRDAVTSVLDDNLPEALAQRMRAILSLALIADPELAYAVHDTFEGAEDALQELLEAHNWRALAAAVKVRAELSEGTYGRVALAVSAAAAGDVDEALAHLEPVWQGDPVDRRLIDDLLAHAALDPECPEGLTELRSRLPAPSRRDRH